MTAHLGSSIGLLRGSTPCLSSPTAPLHNTTLSGRAGLDLPTTPWQGAADPVASRYRVPCRDLSERPKILATLPSGPTYLHAPDNGMVRPANVGQRGAFHLNLHGLDGPCWAQVGHGHLQHRSHLTACLWHSHLPGGLRLHRSLPSWQHVALRWSQPPALGCPIP